MIPIGTGTTADVFDLGDGTVAKVFRPWLPLVAVEYERDLLKMISETAISTSRYVDFRVIDGNHAIVMEKVRGDNFFSLCIRDRRNLHRYLRLFTQVQNEVFDCRHPGLPREKDRFEAQIARSDLENGIKQELVALARALPEHHSICHGDFHFGNLMFSDGRLSILDWMNTYQGNPLGDVVRSHLMLLSPFDPLGLKGFKKVLFRLIRIYVAAFYRVAMRRHFRVEKRELACWTALVAGVRVVDNVPGEREWLERLIKKNLRIATGRGTEEL